MFKRLGFAVSKLDCERVINAEPGAWAPPCAQRTVASALTRGPGTIEQVLKALKHRIERALDLPSETPEPGGGGYNSRHSQSERPAEPPVPAAPYVSYTPAAVAPQARCLALASSLALSLTRQRGSRDRLHRRRRAGRRCLGPRLLRFWNVTP